MTVRSNVMYGGGCIPPFVNAAIDAFVSSTNHGSLQQEILNFTTPFPSQNSHDEERTMMEPLAASNPIRPSSIKTWYDRTKLLEQLPGMIGQ